MKHFKKFEQYAVFDSYYYQHQIKNETIIPLPSKLIRDKYYQIQGFHGIAHFAITRKEKGNVVTCHLGSGCSITASKNGKALATSMYQTPLSGIPMRTRTGDVDVGLLLHLAERHGAKKMRDICYHDSGLSAFVKGGDVRDILKKKRTDVIDYFSYNVSKKVASYLPILQHIDTLIFSGGIGENEHHVRTGICKYLSFLNISLDQKKNKKNAAVISDRKSKIKVKVKSADEDDTMLMILKKEKLLK